MNLHYLWLTVAFFTCSMSSATQSIFLGTLQFPSKIENPAPYPLFYKGTYPSLQIDKSSQISKKGFFEIYEENDNNQFHILITEKIKFPESPDFEFLETEAVYRLFKLTRESKMKEFITTVSAHDKPTVNVERIEFWNIEEIPAFDDNKNIITRALPKDTIILYANPTFITRLESEEWKPDDIYLKLPKIVFDESITEKTVRESSAKMLFAAVDLRCLHTKITKTTKPYAQNCIISVRDPLNCYVNNYTTRL